VKKTEIVYGIHSCRHVLENSFDQILHIWFSADARSVAIAKLKKQAEQQSLSFTESPRAMLDKLSQYARHQGIVIEKRLSEITTVDLESLLARQTGGKPLFLVLDHIQDPHNLGACLRTADAAGVTAVVIPKDNSSGITATVSKVASGAAENIPVITVVNLVRTLKQMQQAGVWIVGTSDDAEKTLYEQELDMSLALVMGGEGKGMKKSVREQCDYLVSIPMLGKVESLNVSVASGIALYEVQRQRGFR